LTDSKKILIALFAVSLSVAVWLLCTFVFSIKSKSAIGRHMTGMSTTRKSTILVLLVYVSCLAVVFAIDDDVRPSDEPSECKCKFPKHHQPDKELLNDIRPLCGKRSVGLTFRRPIKCEMQKCELRRRIKCKIKCENILQLTKSQR